MSSATVSDVAVRDRYKVEAADLVAEIARFLQVSLEGIDTKGIVRATRERLRGANSDGILEGQRQAKAEWGEAVEESDTSRAFRVAEILTDDHDIELSADARTEVEVRLRDEFAEVRAVGMLQAVRKAIPYAPDEKPRRVDVANPQSYTDETIGLKTLQQSPRGFDTELERHRQVIEPFLNVGGSVGRAMEAIWFLLAVAHQPGPGVVEIGGSSPEHEYELEELEEVEAARKRLRNAIDHGNRTNLLTKDVKTIIVAYETANQMNDEDREQIIRLETALAEARGNK